MKPPKPSTASSTFSTPTLLCALGFGVLMAMIFVLFITFAPELRGAEDEGAHALSRSAVGYAGLVRMLKEDGAPVSIRRNATPLQGESGLLVLTPPMGVDVKAVRDAIAIYKGSVLIVAPKWAVSRSVRRQGWATVAGLLPSVPAAATAARPEVRDFKRSAATQPVSLSGGRYQHLIGPGDILKLGPIQNLQSNATDDGVAVLQDANGAAVLIAVGAGRIFVLTDPDILNNRGLADLDTTRSALALIGLLRQGGPVTFDVTLNGLARPRSMMRTALTPPFFAATLCALIAIALVGWRALIRFGPTLRPERAVALGKRALVDNAAGLIRLTRRETKMAPRYADVTRQAAARAVGAPRNWNAEQTDAYLDKLSDPTGETKPFSDLVAAANIGKGDAEALIRSAANLFKWKVEITGGPQ